ncbi:MAG: hypothetical protein RSC10_02675 [Longicatena sp.]
MDDKKQLSQNDEENREIFDVMRNENIDFYNDFFSFRNVLFAAAILGIGIVVCYLLGARLR